MTDKEKIRASKLMSLVLRHNPQKIGISLDDNGWADTDLLLKGMLKNGCKITLEDLKDVVETNDKKRFKFNVDFSKIRANQGHSVAVDVEMNEAVPPDVLYHGTATRFLGAIKSEGLISKSRLHVHLSSERETATKVGSRHGKPVVLTINAAKMQTDGFIFYLSENGVWLVDRVPPEYIWQF